MDEQQLLEKYDKLVWWIVNAFLRSYSGYFINDPEDMHQDALIALLQYIRKCENPEEELEREFPFFQIKSALCMSVLRELPVSVPMRTTNFKRHVATFSDCTVDIESLKNLLSSRYTIDDLDSIVDLHRLIENSDDINRKIIAGRLEGKTTREIGSEIGLSGTAVSLRLKKMSKSNQIVLPTGG